MKKYFVLAPAGVKSGGPELCHQMCAAVNSLGREAYIYYADGNNIAPVDTEPIEEYQKYETAHVTDLEDLKQEDSVFICNEGMTPYGMHVPAGEKLLGG